MKAEKLETAILGRLRLSSKALLHQDSHCFSRSYRVSHSGRGRAMTPKGRRALSPLPLTMTR